MRQAELFATPKEKRPYHELGEKLWELAREHGVHFGSSSWKYESWKGVVYNEPYTSKKDFEQSCLEEYAQVFPAVGGDFSFYNWPSVDLIAQIDRQTPPGFKVGLKATEFGTLRRFPALTRWGVRAGRDNPDFLNARLFKKEFLDRVAPLARSGKLAPVILEFTAFPRGAFNDWTEFATLLEKFFIETRQLAGDGFEFGVELRTREYLHADFYAALQAMNDTMRVAPILNSWTRMPPLDEQLRLFEQFDFPFLECRAVMRPGRAREEAVALFEPYDRNKETNLPFRKSLASMVDWAVARERPAYLFINNHMEGCAHQTIAELIPSLSV